MEEVNRVAGRFEIIVGERAPHGDLYELEQSTYYRVLHQELDRVAMTFEGRMAPSLSAETGLWDDYYFSGVCAVSIAPDAVSGHIKYCNGREELVSLPD